MEWVAVSIVASSVVFAVVLFLLGQRALEVYRADVGVVPDPKPQPVPRETEDDEGHDLDDADVVDFVSSGVESVAAMQYEEWVEEKREEGLDDHEIKQLLDNREPVVII